MLTVSASVLFFIASSSMTFASPSLEVAEETIHFDFEIVSDSEDSMPEEATESSTQNLEDGIYIINLMEETGADDSGEDEDSILILPKEDFPGYSQRYGTIRCEKIGMDLPVYWGDSDQILDWGAGTSTFAYLPGEGEAIILPGHTLTHFSCLQYCEEGDIIEFETDYETYEYEVIDIQVFNENDLLDYFYEILDLVEHEEEETEAAVYFMEEEQEAEEESDEAKEESNETEEESPADEELAEEDPELLVMYTCYPFYPISERKTNRYTVIAKRISGKDIHWGELETEEEEN